MERVMKSTRIAETTCATCGYVFDTASEMTGEDIAPQEGNISVCLRCGQIGFYVQVGDQLTVRSCTAAERDGLINTVPDLRRILAARARIAEEF